MKYHYRVDPEPSMPLMKMAEELSLDLVEDLRSGALETATLSAMFGHCMVCDEQDNCDRFLSTNSGRVVMPPSYCPIGGLLASMQRGDEKPGMLC